MYINITRIVLLSVVVLLLPAAAHAQECRKARRVPREKGRITAGAVMP